jgi:hypothetical protein
MRAQPPQIGQTGLLTLPRSTRPAQRANGMQPTQTMKATPLILSLPLVELAALGLFTCQAPPL